MILGYFVLIPCLIYRFYSHDFRIDCTNIFLNRLLQLDRRVSVNLVGLKGSLRDIKHCDCQVDHCNHCARHASRDACGAGRQCMKSSDA